jgi:Tfp pilus assembly protein PilZ
MKEARREVLSSDLSSDRACHLASPFWLAGSAGAIARPAAMRLVDIHYRSVNALLVAYAAGLSRGEIFLEAAQELPAGTRTLLRLEVSGTAPLQAEGAVSWTRPVALGPGLPAGAAVALAASMEAQGAVIDQLAARFRRIRMLVISGRTEMRATVCRYLRSILNCDITETAVPSASRVVQVLETELEYGLDLVLADLDDAPQHGRSLLPPLIRALSRVAVPLIAFAEHERDRASAAGWGAKEVLGTPPLFSDVRGAVIHALSSPTSCTIS